MFEYVWYDFRIKSYHLLQKKSSRGRNIIFKMEYANRVSQRSLLRAKKVQRWSKILGWKKDVNLANSIVHQTCRKIIQSFFSTRRFLFSIPALLHMAFFTGGFPWLWSAMFEQGTSVGGAECWWGQSVRWTLQTKHGNYKFCKLCTPMFLVPWNALNLLNI